MVFSLISIIENQEFKKIAYGIKFNFTLLKWAIAYNIFVKFTAIGK